MLLSVLMLALNVPNAGETRGANWLVRAVAAWMTDLTVFEVWLANDLQFLIQDRAIHKALPFEGLFSLDRHGRRRPTSSTHSDASFFTTNPMEKCPKTDGKVSFWYLHPFICPDRTLARILEKKSNAYIYIYIYKYINILIFTLIHMNIFVEMFINIFKFKFIYIYIYIYIFIKLVLV